MTGEVTSDSSKTTEIEELKTFISQQRDGRQVKKALAVKLFYQGYGYESIVTILDISMGSVANWKQAYEAEGLSGFQPRHQGRQGYLSATDKASVIEWLQQKPIWTLGELESHLASDYDVVYESKQSYYDLFKAAGLSWKKSSKANPKADEAIVAAKKPRLKACWHATGKKSSRAN